MLASFTLFINTGTFGQCSQFSRLSFSGGCRLGFFKKGLPTVGTPSSSEVKFLKKSYRMSSFSSSRHIFRTLMKALQS